MLKVTVGVCKKLGMPNYSSVGASCELVLELDNVVVENPADFLAQMRVAYSQVRKAVDEELDRQRPEQPEPEPDRENGRREPDREREPAHAGNGHGSGDGRPRERYNRWGNQQPTERAPYRAPRSEPRGRDDRGRSQGPRDGSMPRTGKQLIKWTKDKDETHPNGNGLWQAMIRWAKDEGWDTRVSDWSFDQVKDAQDFVFHYLGITEDPE